MLPTHSRLSAYAASLMLILLLAGCACWPWATKPIDPRAVKSCTDIRNLTEKNYKLGAKFQAILVGLGFDFERSGIKLSNEAAQHQFDMDRFCRQRAAGDITEETWVKMVTDYAAASVASAVRSNNPEALEEVQNNLQALKAELQQLAQRSPQGPSTEGPLTTLDLAKVMSNARESSDSVLSAKLKNLSEKLESQMQISSAALKRGQVEAQEAAGLKEFELLVKLTALEKRVTSLEPSKTNFGSKGEVVLGGRTSAGLVDVPPTPAWQTRPAFRVGFELGSWELSYRAKATLRTALEALRKSPDYRVELFGYTDTSGSPAANAALSAARAQETRDFLMDVLQLEPSKILAVGRQRSVTKFGSPAENRVVEVRTRVLGIPASGLADASP